MMLCVYRAEGKESSKELKDKKKKFFSYMLGFQKVVLDWIMEL